jgi:hypothetical protein
MSCPHVAQRIQNQLNAKQWDMLKHPAYGPDLLPCILYVFKLLKKAFKDHTFMSDDDMQEAVVQWFTHYPKEFFADRIY